MIVAGATGTRTLSSRLSGPPRIVYRDTIWLSLRTRGADAVEFDGQAAALTASFSSHDFDGRSGALAGSFASLGGTALAVTLEAPREVVRVGVIGSGVPYTSELVRLDGTKLAEPATASAAQGSDMPGPPNAFRDAHFAVRFRTSGGLVAGLSGAPNLSELKLRSYPTGPRLGIAANASGAATFFWQTPGQVTSAGANAGGELAAALQSFVDGLEGPLADPLPVALVIESDAPCQVQLTALAVPYSLLRNRFRTAGADPTRATVRLSGAAGESQSVGFELPSAARPSSAAITTSETFVGPAVDPAAAPPALDEEHGLEIAPGAWTAVQLTSASSRALAAVEFGVLALENHSELQLELRADSGGEPAGRALAASSVTLADAGVRRWIALDVSDVALVPSAPLWLLVTAARGRAVWLADLAGCVPPRPLRRFLTAASEDALDQPEQRVVPAVKLRDVEPPGGRPAPSPELSVSLNGQQLSLPAPEDGARHIDFGEELRERAARDAAAGDSIDVDLNLSSTAPASVLVKDLEVRYDLSS